MGRSYYEWPMGLGIRTPPGWGARAALGGTFQALEDLRGNRDGLWGNEDKVAGTTGGLFATQPFLLRQKSVAQVGLRTADEVRELQAFRAEVEKTWGTPTVASDVLAKLKNPELYAAQKAITLSRLERHPNEVTEHFVRAAGSIDGKAIEARDVFTQLWEAKGVPSGRVVVLSPGFQETWRNFVDVIQDLNAAGHDVLVMEHQWASEAKNSGKAGGLDRGFGAARDVAAVTAYAAELAKERHGVNGAVILAGNSMGGGPGAFGAAIANAADLIELEGPPMPKGIGLALFDPFLGATPNKTNELLALASRVPIANDLAVPTPGVPDLTDDPVAEQLGAQDAVMGDVRARLSTMTKALPDIERMMLLAEQFGYRLGPTKIVHASGDPLADPAKAERLAELLGDQTELRWVDSEDHVLQQSPTQRANLVQAVNDLAAAPHGTVGMPHSEVTLREPLEVRLNENGSTGTVRFEIPLDDVETQPLGPRAFGDAIRVAKLQIPHGVDGGDAKFEVRMDGGEPTLFVEAPAYAGAFQQLKSHVWLTLESGQNVMIGVTPTETRYDFTDVETKQRRGSLEHANKTLEARQDMLADLESMLANPDSMPITSRIDGRPADQVATEELARARAELESANATIGEVRNEIDATWDELTLPEKSFVMMVAYPQPEDATWHALEADIKKHYDSWRQHKQEADNLTAIIGALSDHPDAVVADERRELITEVRATQAAEKALKAALDAGKERFEQLSQQDRLRGTIGVLHPSDRGPDALKYALGAASIAQSSVDVWTNNLDRYREDRQRRLERLPDAIANMRAEVEKAEARVAELERLIAEPPPVFRTMRFEGPAV